MHSVDFLVKTTGKGLKHSATLYKDGEKVGKKTMPYSFSDFDKKTKENTHHLTLFNSLVQGLGMKKRLGSFKRKKGQIKTYEVH